VLWLQSQGNNEHSNVTCRLPSDSTGRLADGRSRARHTCHSTADCSLDRCHSYSWVSQTSTQEPVELARRLLGLCSTNQETILLRPRGVWWWPCLSVCDHIFGTASPIFTKFLCTLPMTVARSSSGGVAMRYTFPVLCMTPCLYIMANDIGDGRIPQWLVRTHHGFDTVACTQIGPSEGLVQGRSLRDIWDWLLWSCRHNHKLYCALVVVLCKCNRWNQSAWQSPVSMNPLSLGFRLFATQTFAVNSEVTFYQT